MATVDCRNGYRNDYDDDADDTLDDLGRAAQRTVADEIFRRPRLDELDQLDLDGGPICQGRGSP